MLGRWARLPTLLPRVLHRPFHAERPTTRGGVVSTVWTPSRLGPRGSSFESLFLGLNSDRAKENFPDRLVANSEVGGE